MLGSKETGVGDTDRVDICRSGGGGEKVREEERAVLWGMEFSVGTGLRSERIGRRGRTY